MATTIAQRGAAPHIVEAVLGHTRVHSAVNSIYNKYLYIDEHRIALQYLADHYDTIT